MDLIDRQARFWGVSTDEYLAGAFAPELFGEGEAVNLQGKRGGTAFLLIGDTLKALIHLSETADFSTWLHETGHAFINYGVQNRERSSPIAGRMAEIEHAFGVKNGEWNAQAEKSWEDWFKTQQIAEGGNLSYNEIFSYALEDYMRTGRAPNEQVRSLLQRIAEWLRGIYQTLRNRVRLSP